MEQTYRAFGLAIRSELPLPDLPTTGRAPQVEIRRVPVEDWQGEATVRYGERCRILGQKWFVRFKLLPFTGLITNGDLIQFDSDPTRNEIARLHVLGSCTGAMLFQRGFVPIHGNTILSPYGAAMLVGRIGAGKSATTMALLERENRLVADDTSAISFESIKPGDPPVVLAGFPRLKLWKASLEHFRRNADDFHRLRPGLDKFHVPVESQFCEEPQPLRNIYILQPRDGAAVRVRALTGLAKLDAIRVHLYKIRFPDAIRNFPWLLGKMCRIADTVRVNLVERPREGNTIEEVADAISRDMVSDHRSRNAASVA